MNLQLSHSLGDTGARFGQNVSKVLGSRAQVASQRAVKNWELLLRKVFGNALR